MSRSERKISSAAEIEPDPDARARSEELSKVFRNHNSALVRFVLSRVRNEQEAKEVAQEAYVRLLELEHPVTVGYLRWYLFRIAKFIAIDRHRQRAIRLRLDRLRELPSTDLSDSTERSCVASDQLSRVMSSLKELPPKCQQAFLLHRLRGLSTIEVAANMGISDRMARSYMRKALIYCRLRSEGVEQDEAIRLSEC